MNSRELMLEELRELTRKLDERLDNIETDIRDDLTDMVGDRYWLYQGMLLEEDIRTFIKTMCNIF